MAAGCQTAWGAISAPLALASGPDNGTFLAGGNHARPKGFERMVQFAIRRSRSSVSK
jgi:hypothetical protein